MKIGIAIKTTSSGSGQPIVINEGGDWTQNVIDVRDIIKHVPSMLSDHTKPILFMSFTNDACLLTVSRTISGRSWDNVSWWIHIPNNMDIDGREVSSIISKVKELIKDVDIPEESELNETFCKEYDSKNLYAQYKASSKNQKFAKLDTNNIYTLEERLDKDRYQSCYSEYSAVFIVDDISTVENADDLSGFDRTSSVILIPPRTDVVRNKLGIGVTIYKPDGLPFYDPIYVNKGETIWLSAVRPGFEPIKFPHKTEENVNIKLPKKEWKKIISRELFNIKSESGIDLNNRATIRVNNKILTDTCSFSEEDCKNAQIEVSAKDYETNVCKQDLTSLQCGDKLTLKLKANYERDIRLRNGTWGKVSISGGEIAPNTCPLKGYIDNNGCLMYKPKNMWLQRLIGFGTAVAIWLILLLIGWLPTGHGDSDNNKDDTDTIKVTNELENEYSDANAIHYLDSNDTWDKDEMEKYPILKELFDDLNNMNTNKLAYEWENVLCKSTKFKEIANVAKKNLDKGWNPKQGSHDPTYNTKPSDLKIIIEGYINWLDKDQTIKDNPPTIKTKKGDNNEILSSDKAKKAKETEETNNKRKKNRDELS